MIKVRIADLLNSTATLQKLANANLKARTAWQVAKLLKIADSEIQDFNTTRMKVINKYGEKDENDNLITDEAGNCKIKEDCIEDFTNELNELLGSEVEIATNKIKLDDLEDLNFTPNEMNILEAFIDFE